jgi:hypothetical protein
MSISTQRQSDQYLISRSSTPAESHSPDAPLASPQVKPKKPYAPRRRFDAAYKRRFLLAYNACTDASERGALLRREGLYHARIAAWRKELADGKLHDKKRSPNKLRTDHLVRENERLKKKLAQAEAIIDLQKKVSELLGVHILPHESNDES